MSRRLRRLPANQLTTRVSETRRQLEQQKAAQIAGSHNIVLVRTVTGNTTDFTVTATYGVTQQWTVTFTPVDTTFPNLGFCWQGFFVTFAAISNTWISIDSDDASGKVTRFTCMGNNSGATDVFDMYVVIYAVGPGTISIVKTI